MDSEARKLEAAVEAGDFKAIPGLAAAYRRSAVLLLARTADADSRRAILREARESLNRSLQLAKARRAHIAARFKAATAQASAFDTPQSSLHTWQIEA